MSSGLPALTDKISVIGLGYVGLPLLVKLAQSGSLTNLVGFDIDESHIQRIRTGEALAEYIGERNPKDLLLVKSKIELSSDPKILTNCRVFIVAVPTPVDDHHVPRLEYLIAASEFIGQSIKDSSFKDGEKVVVIYESTVYPGVTESICKKAVLSSGVDAENRVTFGYSPERINPGDKINNLATIKKVISADRPETLDWMETFYGGIVDAGTHRVSSIMVAECAKALENTQRDINIALVNEVAMLCGRLSIDTNEVIDAACTKWNFMDVRPGLVGGHCISVDPYYLAFAAQSVGIQPRLINAGRNVNDGMPGWIARRAVKHVVSLVGPGKIYRCLIMGMTYKENCADIRNSKSLELYRCMISYGIHCDITDPLLEDDQSHENIERTMYNVKRWEDTSAIKYDLIIISVAHREYRGLSLSQLTMRCKSQYILYDLKNVLPLATPNLLRL